MLGEQAIFKLIQNGESETLEFKEKLNENALETLSAFANQKGGILLIGITDDGKIKGWDANDRELSSVVNKIADSLKIHPSVNRTNISGTPILSIEVLTSGIPIAYHGQYFKRVGSTTRAMNTDEMGGFFVSKMGITWDGIAENYNPDEFDAETINEFISSAQKRLPLLKQGEPIYTIFQKLDLLKEDKPTRGAIMLFGKFPQRYFLTTQVHVGRFKDGSTIIDDKILRGNLFQLLNQVMQLLQQYQKVRIEIDHDMSITDAAHDLQRKEVWDFPLDALREALLNAMVHRDYFVSTGEINIKVLDNRIVISNPGELLPAITINELKEEIHRSVPRNPIMAQVLYYAGLIEKWGTGTTRIIKLCKQNNLPDPEFDSRGGWFTFTISRETTILIALDKFDLKERQIMAIKQLNESGKITAVEYERHANVSKATAKRDITDLVKKGLLIKSGTTGRGVYYILKDNRDQKSSMSSMSSQSAQTAHKQLKKGSTEYKKRLTNKPEAGQ